MSTRGLRLIVIILSLGSFALCATSADVVADVVAASSMADVKMKAEELARKIIESQKELERYHVGGFLYNTGSTLGYAGVSGITGAITGLITSLIAADQDFRKFEIGSSIGIGTGVLSQFLQMNATGFLAGIWGFAGNNPRLSWSTMIKMLILHQVISNLLLFASFRIADTDAQRALYPALSQLVAFIISFVEMSYMTGKRTSLEKQRVAAEQNFLKLQNVQRAIDEMELLKQFKTEK